MKRCLVKYLLLFCTLSIGCFSCGVDEPENDTVIEEPEEKIEYYVKYESYINIPSSKVSSMNIRVLTEKGVQSMDVPLKWEGIFGPFYELESLFIFSKGGNYNVNMTSSRGRISICRGNQPFILKADKSFQGTQYSMSYKVTKEDLK